MIINTNEINQIYVAAHYVDMRKQIDGLIVIVNAQFNMNILDHSLFIFTNKARNRLKILYYESNGFWLLTKRLEHGRFKIFEDDGKHVNSINQNQLNWLLEGLEYNSKKYDEIKEKTIFV
ncbi:MAG: IS66 family insertion sequence element accessory protein TnpB [Erysipelotrichaceae bacterium]|nr:IS66 family insertion sequence element accessory protein TnpB [Erysipelotrichaceae bacterium]